MLTRLLEGGRGGFRKQTRPVRPEWTIAGSRDHFCARGRDSETLNVIYVTDASWRILDALDLRKFILAGPDATVQSIMDGICRTAESIPRC